MSGKKSTGNGSGSRMAEHAPAAEPTRGEVLQAFRAYIEWHEKHDGTVPWRELAEVDPMLWDFLPGWCAVEAAAKIEASEECRARAAYITKMLGRFQHESGMHDKLAVDSQVRAARHLLVCHSAEVRGVVKAIADKRNAAKQLADVFANAWITHASNGLFRPPMDAVNSFRSGVVIVFPRCAERLERISDEQILEMIKLWASNEEGRPPAGTKRDPELKTKWTRLVKFVQDATGQKINARSLGQASTDCPVRDSIKYEIDRLFGSDGPMKDAIGADAMKLRLYEQIYPPTWRAGDRRTTRRRTKLSKT